MVAEEFQILLAYLYVYLSLNKYIIILNKQWLYNYHLVIVGQIWYLNEIYSLVKLN